VCRLQLAAKALAFALPGLYQILALAKSTI
jgi:hypothetical protein